MKIKTGDEVLVIAGKDKGSKGTVLAVFEDRNKVIVEGRNIAKRHTKARSANQKADIIEKPMPIHVSNVMLVVKGKPSRVGYKINADGTKVRIAKKTGEEV